MSWTKANQWLDSLRESSFQFLKYKAINLSSVPNVEGYLIPVRKVRKLIHVIFVMNAVKAMIKNLLSDSNDVSHKRLIGLISFIVLIVLSFFSAYGHKTDDNFVYVFASLTGGESILTVIEKFKS